MFILFCYLMAFIPLVIGTGLWLFCKKIVWWESLIGTVIGIIIVLLFQLVGTSSQTDDTETWSGQVLQVSYIPSWEEYYEYEVYRTEYYTTTERESYTEYYTDSKGKSKSRTKYRTVIVRKSRQVFDHWGHATRQHYAEYYLIDSFCNMSISSSLYNDILNKFGNTTKQTAGRRKTGDHNSHMISGDPMDYTSVNTTNYIYPVNKTCKFENRIKASKSIFSFVKIDEKDDTIFSYPTSNDHFDANRTLGKVGVDKLVIEQLNSVVGPKNHVNIIVVGYDDKPIEEALKLESKWISGKKNDLVICFSTKGSALNKPQWVYVFTWSESDLCKENIKSIILKNGLTKDSIPLIQKEIENNFKIKDWHKFDYITIEIPICVYIWLFIIEIVLVGSWFLFAFFNDADKISKEDVNKKKFTMREYNYYDIR